MKNSEKSKIRHRLSMLENLVYRSWIELKELHDDLSKDDDSEKNCQIVYVCMHELSWAWRRVADAKEKTNDLEVIKKEKRQ